MVQYIEKKDIPPLVIFKFMERSSNPNYLIDFGRSLYSNIRFHIVNKITSKRIKYKWCSQIPGQN